MMKRSSWCLCSQLEWLCSLSFAEIFDAPPLMIEDLLTFDAPPAGDGEWVPIFAPALPP
jgi:hypothetical protein